MCGKERASTIPASASGRSLWTRSSGELDEPTHDHEAGVREEAHESRRENLAEYISIQPPQHAAMVAGRGAPRLLFSRNLRPITNVR